MTPGSLRPKAMALLACLAVAGCDRAGAAAPDEVAAELRALRQALLAQPRAAAPRTPGSSATEITAAMAPLREALAAMAANQRDLQQRQLALTQELQRWSSLLVENTDAARRDQGEALTQRLQQLEAALQAQDVRHREVEALMQGALERTADRLGDFLQRVGAGVDAAADSPAPALDGGAGAADKADATSPPGGGEPPAAPASGKAADGVGTRWQRRSGASWWWGGAAAMATFAGVLCLRRLRQSTDLPRAVAREIGPIAEPATRTAAGGDPDVQEIWAAAALLGEAVGRLRDSTAAADAVPAAEPDDEWVVLDDELLTPDAAPAEPPPVLRGEPAAATCRLRTEDPARSMQSVLAILQSDPRVLRRPEPAVRCSHEWLEVSFRWLPEVPPGERSHLEQRLRDACRSGA